MQYAPQPTPLFVFMPPNTVEIIGWSANTGSVKVDVIDQDGRFSTINHDVLEGQQVFRSMQEAEDMSFELKYEEFNAESNDSDIEELRHSVAWAESKGIDLTTTEGISEYYQRINE